MNLNASLDRSVVVSFCNTLRELGPEMANPRYVSVMLSTCSPGVVMAPVQTRTTTRRMVVVMVVMKTMKKKTQ